MTKYSTSSRDKKTELTEWEMRMAKLVGLDKSTPADIEDESSTDLNSQPQIYESNSNLAQQPFSANPFAKVGLVGASTLAIVMFAGGFLSQIMSNGNPQISQNAIRRKIPEKPKTKPRVEQLEAEIEGLKTKLALGEQLDAVKAAQQKLRTSQPKPSKPTVTVKKPPQIQQQTIPRPKPQKPQIRIVEVPKIVTVDRIVKQPESKPRAEPTPAIPQIPPPPPPEPQEPLVEIAPPQTSPMEEWTRLAKLGSYGQVSLSANQTVSNRTFPRQTELSREIEQRETQSKAQREITSTRARKTVNRNSQTTLVGTSAKAILTTAIYGENTKSNKDSDQKNQDNNIYVLRLKQPLKAADGNAALPIGSQILTKVDSISENGLIQLDIVKIIIRKNGKVTEKKLPRNALMIRDKKGKPLIAKQYRNNSSSVASRDAALFALGGLGKAAELINRTESEVVTGENGTVAVTNVNRNPSTAAGILEGGMKAVVPQISRRNQRAISQMSRKTNIWYLPQGKEVEIFVNQETQI